MRDTSSFAAAALLAAVIGAAPASHAAISFRTESGNQPILFGSGMVLQRDRTVPVWGTALPNASVVANLVDPSQPPGSQLLQTLATTSDASGRWVVRFAPMPAGGPYELDFFENAEATPSVVMTDVLFGDVWLLSGQSNMVIRVPRDGDPELYPDVRAITTVRWGQRPSGAAFYFGAELSDYLGIPIGLVNRAVPDTALAHWLPVEVADDEDPVARELFTGCGAAAGDTVNRCQFYDLYIRPLERPVAVGEEPEGLALRGVVWWQGEKGYDRRGTGAYAHLFPAMMRAWRANLGQPDLPFVFHQLPSGTGLRWTALRLRSLPLTNRLDDWQGMQHAMFFRMLAFPRTSLMTSMDLGSGTHPKEFDRYGRRLGASALGTTYVAAGDLAPFPYSGPIYESATLEPVANGPDEVRIRFRSPTAEGLVAGPAAAPAAPLHGFALCCNEDGAFVFADARIENGNEVVVSHADVATPSVVNYAIGHNPAWANLFNEAELAAAPFSTALAPFADQDPDGDGFWEPGPYVEQ